MVPAQDLADMLGLMAVPDYVVLICLAVIMMPFSRLGVSPIMMAVFFERFWAAFLCCRLIPLLAALAISSGWALSMTTSPFATVVLMMSSMNGKHPLQLTVGVELDVFCFGHTLFMCHFLCPDAGVTGDISHTDCPCSGLLLKRTSCAARQGYRFIAIFFVCT